MFQYFQLSAPLSPDVINDIVYDGKTAILLLSDNKTIALGHGFDDGGILLPAGGLEADYIIVCNPKLVSTFSRSLKNKIMWSDTPITNIYCDIKDTWLLISDNDEIIV